MNIDQMPKSSNKVRPFRNRHILTTNTEAENFHNSVVVDPHTPRNLESGEPLFRAVWHYLLLAETPVLSFEIEGAASVEIHWQTGTLQQSTNFIHWDDTTGAQSPLRISRESMDTSIFYRVQQ
ncbi:MAG: hypothetical protein ACI9R3_001897 [Verrucomicrobiales bacterium]|jgi:hypothetical protein